MMASENLGYIQSYLEHVLGMSTCQTIENNNPMASKYFILFGDFQQFAPVQARSLVNTYELSTIPFPNKDRYMQDSDIVYSAQSIHLLS